MPFDIKDQNLLKKLCDIGMAVSFSEGRRLIQCLPEEKLKNKMEAAEKKMEENKKSS